MSQVLKRLSIALVCGGVLVALCFTMVQPAYGQCPNLIVNGDFEAGNTGFTTDYIYSQSIINPQHYYITADPHTTSLGCFQGGDHTTGSGNMMAVNGALYSTKCVWRETVDVEPHATYTLSAWVSNHCGTTSPANLSFRINGTQVGASFLAPSTVAVWSQYEETWSSGTNTTATIEIYDLNTDYDLNDFALDDISFTMVDVTPPHITRVNGLTMWPPNHEYHTFTVSQLASVSDNCDPSPDIYIILVGSDEPENAIGDGDGNTTDDIIIAPDCQSVQLRAERDGNGNGRVYTVWFRAYDHSGNGSRNFCWVSVNHDPDVPAVYGGPNPGYGVESNCFLSKESAPASVPLQFTLEQNYPNPFNPSTVIPYSIATETRVMLAVYDHLGRRVAVLVNGTVQPGSYQATFNAENLPSGSYMYRLDTPQGSLTRKMILTK